ncbi:MAG: AAA family ATPase [Acidimicrobiales bacterium]
MKLGVVGKGGVGKTTVSALLSQGFVARGRRVVAIDTDSNPNLGISLGLTFNEAEAIPVIPRSLVMGAQSGMSPEELMREYGRETPVGVRILSAMRVSQAGAG